MKEIVYNIFSPVNARIALISDTHNTDPTHVIRSLEIRRPDIIAVTGDFLVGYRPEDDTLLTESQKNVIPLFESCASIAPTFVSLGNHEWIICDEDIGLIRKTGAVVVDNSWEIYGSFAIGGLTPAIVCNFREFRNKTEERYPYRPKYNGKLTLQTDWLDDFESSEGYRILLCHHPEYYPAYLYGRDIDLILSGHSHGGQIRLFGRGLYSPGQGWMPKYAGGVYDGKLVVSRGLTNSARPIPRLFNPTEIVYVNLVGEKWLEARDNAEVINL